MTIEEKAKAYDEALKWMRELYPGLHGATKEDAEHYFPELRESEDERIRKELIEFIKWSVDRHFMREDFHQAKRPSEWIAYLEKQKEQKEQPISAEEVLVRAGLKPYKDGNQWCILAGDNIQEGICGFGDTIEDALYEFLKEVLDFPKEQKPVVTHGETYHVDTLGTQQVIAGKMPQKPAEWSEEDEDMLNCCISSIEEAKENRYAYKETDGDTSYDREIAFLKSLRPQPQQNMSIGFMLYLDEHRPDGKMCLSNAECNEIETAFKNQSWDTILRYVEKYQPHWKPSNAQINHLGAAVIEAQRRHNESVNGFPRYHALKELYEQLLKL